MAKKGQFKVNKEQEKEIIKERLNGFTLQKSANKHNVAVNSIKNCLRRNNIKINNPNRLKGVNHNYLDSLDTPNKAYFLGFMYADGCIITKKQGQKQIVINLHERDVDILLKFKKELDFEGNLHFYDGKKISRKNYKWKRSNLYRLTVSSDRLCDNLIRLGCEPRKSHTCKFPTLEQVPEWLMPHFIRGLMDGDGYIAKRQLTKTCNPTFSFGIVGTLNICNGVRKWLSNKLILNPRKKLRKCKRIYGIAYANNKDMIKIYNYLYPKNVELFLLRKKNKFEEIFKYNYNNRNNKTYEESLKTI